MIYTNNRDAPETTLQESSFQPAGAANPMPSISYDFFAPLGEFGQMRDHYHEMRRLHLFVESWGSVLASTVPVPPAPIPADNTSLRSVCPRTLCPVFPFSWLDPRCATSFHFAGTPRAAVSSFGAAKRAPTLFGS